MDMQRPASANEMETQESRFVSLRNVLLFSRYINCSSSPKLSDLEMGEQEPSTETGLTSPERPSSPKQVWDHRNENEIATKNCTIICAVILGVLLFATFCITMYTVFNPDNNLPKKLK